MYARLMASVCLLNVGAFAGSSAPADEGSRGIVVYLRHRAGAQAAVIDALQQETGAQMSMGGYHVQWPVRLSEVTAAYLVIVDLDSPPSPQAGAKRLASAAIEDGRILPFIHVNCRAVRDLLAPAIGSTINPQLYGRALGRLVAHELYHVVGQTAGHASTGVAQIAVSCRELLSERFTFDRAALKKLRNPDLP
jgi:hypothetical protein